MAAKVFDGGKVPAVSGGSIPSIDRRKLSTSRAAAWMVTRLSPTSFGGSLVLEGNVFTDCLLVIVFIIPVVVHVVFLGFEASKLQRPIDALV
jgi:hypothetical protein